MAETTPNNAEDETPSKGDESAAKPTEKRAQKTAGEEDPSISEENISVDRSAPDVVVENLHSTTVAEATDIPTANAPDPKAVNPEVNPNATADKPSDAVSTVDESAAKPSGKPTAKAAPPKGDKPAAAKAAKKEKAPAVEDKPFTEFIQQHYLPALKSAFAEQGVQNLELTFEKQKVPIIGYNTAEECWQVMGRWQSSISYQFNVYFPQEDIQGQRAFSCNEGSKPSTLEPFLIDERKVSLDLMVFGVVQRLNGQKWLTRN